MKKKMFNFCINQFFFLKTKFRSSQRNRLNKHLLSKIVETRFFSEYKSNLSTTATLGTEESGRCREILNKSQCMDFLSAGTQEVAVVLREVAVSGGSTVVFFVNVKFLSACVFCNYR